jgi:hypothetical protein
MLFEASDWQMVLVASTFLDRVLEFAIGRAFKNELTPAEGAEIFSGYGSSRLFLGKNHGRLRSRRQLTLLSKGDAAPRTITSPT